MSHILLIDDDLPTQRVYGLGLRKAGHMIELADNAKLLTRLTADRVPDLIISDVVMPEVDGFEALAIVRENFPKLPIITISGTNSYLEMSGVLGAHKTLLKPFTINQLIEAVNEVLPDVN